MKGYVKILLLVVAAAVAVSVGVYAYYLTMPRLGLLLYTDTMVTGCRDRLNETLVLHVKNDGSMDLHIYGFYLSSHGQTSDTTDANYTFQSDIVIPVGVEAVITFPAGGGEVLVETVSGPSGAVATGGVYAVSDNPDPNPFTIIGEDQWFEVYTRSGIIDVSDHPFAFNP